MTSFMWRSRAHASAIVASALLVGSVAVTAASLGYKVIGKYTVSGDGRWDDITFEVATKRLCVAHGNTVDERDPTTEAPLEETPNTAGVHGVGCPPGRDT